MSKLNRKKLGQIGENMACKYLSKNGYIIWHRNWIYKKGEIDIICSKGRTLSIVEVKLRNENFSKIYKPIDAINERKIRQLKYLGARFFRNNLGHIRRRRITKISYDAIAITYTKQKLLLNKIKQVSLEHVIQI